MPAPSARAPRPYARRGGVYIIENTINGRIYVGSGHRPQKRWNSHRWELRRGTHRNVALQTDFEQYGEAAFTFRILESCPLPETRTREEYWIQSYRSRHPYNMRAADAPSTTPEQSRQAWLRAFSNEP